MPEATKRSSVLTQGEGLKVTWSFKQVVLQGHVAI